MFNEDTPIVGEQDKKRSKKQEKKAKEKGKAKQIQPPEDLPAGDGGIEETKHDEKRRKKEKKSKAREADAQSTDSNEMVNGGIAGAEEESPKKSKKDTSLPDVTGGKKSRKRKRDEKESTTEIAENAANDKKRKKKTSGGDTTLAELELNPNETHKEVPRAVILDLPSSADISAFLKKHSITVTLPTGVSDSAPVITFGHLDVHQELKKALDGFNEPTPIQACAWPHALQGRDVVGIAETGSGKTLAFGIPALARLVSDKSSQASGVSILVVAPTRELAIQTHETLSDLGKPFGIASVAVFGGVPKEGQVQMLRRAGVAQKSKNKRSKEDAVTRIVVGTPGRILDLVQDGVCDLSGVDYLVLDEADRMLDKGFENDIRQIIGKTKPLQERQTMMFSATWPEAVRRLAGTFQRNPVRVTVGSDDLTANSRVEQFVEVLDERQKDSRLVSHLNTLSHKKKGGSTRILVFALYKKEASRVEFMLRSQGYTVGALHGDMTQNARMEALEKFKNGTTGLLVATDVAARGLDIPDVAAVINYTFPLTIEDYIHRIGRTGRGGKSGKSITFFTGDGHEKALAGEFARVLREGGFDYEALKKFPMTIKKKEHSVYGAFYRDDIPAPKGPTKIKFS